MMRKVFNEMGPSMKSSFNESIYSQRKYDVRNARNCAKKKWKVGDN